MLVAEVYAKETHAPSRPSHPPAHIQISKVLQLLDTNKSGVQISKLFQISHPNVRTFPIWPRRRPLLACRLAGRNLLGCRQRHNAPAATPSHKGLESLCKMIRSFMKYVHKGSQPLCRMFTRSMFAKLDSKSQIFSWFIIDFLVFLGFWTRAGELACARALYTRLLSVTRDFFSFLSQHKLYSHKLHSRKLHSRKLSFHSYTLPFTVAYFLSRSQTPFRGHRLPVVVIALRSRSQTPIPCRSSHSDFYSASFPSRRLAADFYSQSQTPFRRRRFHCRRLQILHCLILRNVYADDYRS